MKGTFDYGRFEYDVKKNIKLKKSYLERESHPSQCTHLTVVAAELVVDHHCKMIRTGKQKKNVLD